MPDELRVTSGREWREREQRGVLLQLPNSGLVARIRGVGPDLLIKTGRIPDSLTPIIAHLVDGGTLQNLPKPQTIKDLEPQIDFINAVCQDILLEPRMVEHPEADDEIGLYDIPYTDKLWLVGAVGLATRDLESFRVQQTGSVDAVGTPEGHRASRKRPPKNKGVQPAEVPSGRLVDGAPVRPSGELVRTVDGVHAERDG